MSNLIIQIENPHVTSFLMTMIMLAVSVDILEICTDKMCMTLSETFGMCQGEI